LSLPVSRIAAAAALAGLFALSGIAVVILPSPLPLASWLEHPVASFVLSRGGNPSPVDLLLPPAAPLSAMAQLGRQIFFDPSLSASGKLSCSSCHSPAQHYAPPLDLPVMLGGPQMASQGVRAVPSLMYLERQPNFSIGPDNEESENVSLGQLAAQSMSAARAAKTAQSTAQTATNLVPQGGLTWDGRADTLQQQAAIPLLSPLEMDNADLSAAADKLHAAPYAAQIQQFFGATIFNDPRMAVAEAMFAVARYQIEAPSFHPYSSKYDAWLEGKARLNPAELRGYLLFNDPAKADCAGCHLDQPTADHQPPLFTDHQFEALGVPRNPALLANRNPSYFDLGLCGPYRTDLASQTQYCGMFLTPTLRNVATRHAFFHNGLYDNLQQVLDFYNFRDTAPQKIYPPGRDGKPEKFNDLPPALRANIDRTDPPLNQHFGDKPAMRARDEQDIIAFLSTLTDGYRVKSP
jgi:cytochrome c peroxidase